MRTRVKICGITRLEDVHASVAAGADAIGLVFYAPSPRALKPQQAARLVDALPPFVQSVALFVNPTAAEVDDVLQTARPALLQFHGDESPEFCAGFGVPWIKACRIKPGVDLLEYFTRYPDTRAWLADAWVEGYGGAGQRFDWNVLPQQRRKPLILSGGLSPENVAAAIHQVKPWAVDVSSGVEAAPGLKDAAKLAMFMKEVRNADL